MFYYSRTYDVRTKIFTSENDVKRKRGNENARLQLLNTHFHHRRCNVSFVLTATATLLV